MKIDFPADASEACSGRQRPPESQTGTATGRNDVPRYHNIFNDRGIDLDDDVRTRGAAEATEAGLDTIFAGRQWQRRVPVVEVRGEGLLAIGLLMVITTLARGTWTYALKGALDANGTIMTGDFKLSSRFGGGEGSFTAKKQSAPLELNDSRERRVLGAGVERHGKDNFRVHPSSQIDTDDIAPRRHLDEFESPSGIG